MAVLVRLPQSVQPVRSVKMDFVEHVQQTPNVPHVTAVFAVYVSACVQAKTIVLPNMNVRMVSVRLEFDVLKTRIVQEVTSVRQGHVLHLNLEAVKSMQIAEKVVCA